MSADHWHWCPVCVDKAQAEHGRKVAELEAAYVCGASVEYRSSAIVSEAKS